MKEEEKTEDLGFKINDRRRFYSDGSSKPEEEVAPVPTPPQPPPPEPAPVPPEKAEQTPPAPAAEPVEENSDAGSAEFSELIFSLAASAQAALGLGGGPGSSGRQNLAQAKHVIDLLSVLEQKTQGNLSAEEAQILQALLYELRMHYIQAKPNI